MFHKNPSVYDGIRVKIIGLKAKKSSSAKDEQSLFDKRLEMGRIAGSDVGMPGDDAVDFGYVLVG
jgi:hypothetical protein